MNKERDANAVARATDRQTETLIQKRTIWPLSARMRVWPPSARMRDRFTKSRQWNLTGNQIWRMSISDAKEIFRWKEKK